MGTTTHSIDVNAPLQSVYNQWTQFEEFPRFMRDVVEVRQHGRDALSWKVLMGGKEKKWEARIIEQIPDTSIVWESVDGTSNRGAITFEPLGTDTTRLTVVMEYEPEGLLEKAADILGVPSGHVEESLKSFRKLIESKSTATGGWRGRIESTDLEKESVEELAPAPGTTSLVGLRPSDEVETHQQAVPVTEAQAGEHEAGMVARPNDADQELQIRQPLSAETETPPVKVDTVGSDPYPSLQAVPVTGLEAGEHEAGMIARVSDAEESRKVDPMHSAQNDLEPKTAKADTVESLRGDTFFEPNQEEVARRAYDLYLARGQVAGHEIDDWIEAKRQLLEENNSKI
jgi:Polyketide cyclase / dehydrase and lipid transport/Protein of unknown function (DUF2934)